MPIPNYKRLGGAASAAAAEGLVVFREKPLQLDSAGLVWQLKYTPDPQYVWPVLNGVELDPYYPTGAPQFTLDGNVLTLAEPVIPSDSDDWWWVWYFRKGKKGGSGNRSGKARQFGAPADVGGPGTAVALGRMAGNVWLQARLVPNLATPLMAGNSLQIGSAGTYSVVNTLNNSNPYELKAGPMPLWALIDAINGDASNGAAGVWFSSATPPNQDVVASITSGGILLQVIAGAVDGSITVDMGGTGGRIQITLPDSNTTYYPSVTLTGGYMLDGDTVTIGSVTYTFKGSLGFDNAVAGHVLIDTSDGPGLSLDYAIPRLVAAINGGPGAGTVYSSATTPHPDVTAAYETSSMNMAVTAKQAGEVSIALSTSSGGRFFWTAWSGGTTSGGGSGSDTDVVNFGSNPDQRVTGNCSIGIWIRIPSNCNGKSTLIVRGVSDPASAKNSVYALTVQGESDDWAIKYWHDYGTDAVEKHLFETHIKNDVWYYVGMSRNVTAKTVTLYIGNGSSVTLVDTWTYSNNPDGGTDSACELAIGNYPGGEGVLGDGTRTGPCIGTIEEQYIWSRELSSAEHRDAMKGNPSLTGLVHGCYMGDDPEVDFSAIGASGQVTGTTLVQGHP